MVGDNPFNTAVCRCGETTIELAGKPIQSLTCCCESCRTAALGFERDLGAPHSLNAEGGVDYCQYRKDRVRIAHGGEHLREYRLKPDSPTRRVVAACCQSPMFLDFGPGHWLSMFRDRLTGPSPKPRMRVMTKDRTDAAPPPSDIPSYPAYPPRFMFTLLAAWAAMGFRRPKIVW
jgi:hypothetical protein